MTTTVNLAASDTVVTAPNKGDNPQVGQPSVASLARGILANTGIQQANSKLAHMCDFSQDVRRSALLKKYLKAIANGIRQGIRAVMKFLGLSDESGVFSQVINYLKNKLQEVNNFLKTYIKKIKDFLTFVTTFITLVAAIIQWILNLPANIKALLIDCLQKLTKAIAGVLVPRLAVAGLKVAVPLRLSVMPGPENVPAGAWLPVNSIEAASAQYDASITVKLTEGLVTVMVALPEVELVQLLASLTVILEEL